jgi:putative sugar O-methyltransferase
MVDPALSRATSITDNEFYLSSVRAALEDDEAFASCKQLAGIKGAVERLPEFRGAEYRDIVYRQTPGLLEYLEKFRENDSIGRPQLGSYPDGPMSPTTWRYVKVVSDLQMLFRSLDGWHVAEIGVGYGGQCKILSDVYDVASYTMYDLEPVIGLAQKYQRRLQSRAADKVVAGDFRRLGDGEPGRYDLVISNWALSECTRGIQDLYIEHVLRRSMHGYITYNQISGSRGIDSYRKDEFIEALGFPAELMAEGLDIPELPKESENFILHWSTQPCLD